jgi:hypothetical protein
MNFQPLLKAFTAAIRLPSGVARENKVLCRYKRMAPVANLLAE